MVLPLRDENPERRGRPWITIALIAANLVVFVLFQPQARSILDRFDGDAQRSNVGTEFVYRYAVIPCEIRQGAPLNAAEVAADECGIDQAVRVRSTGEVFAPVPIFPDKNVWLAGLVAMFLHGSWLHLLANLWFLWVFGDNVEQRFGHVGFALLYLVSGVIATAAQVLADTGSVVPMVGASGAIAGVMGAYLVLFPRNRIITWVPILLIVVLPLPAFLVLGAWFVLQFFTEPGSSVAWIAHVGGFVAGAAITYALRGVVGHPRRQFNDPPPATEW